MSRTTVPRAADPRKLFKSIAYEHAGQRVIDPPADVKEFSRWWRAARTVDDRSALASGVELAWTRAPGSARTPALKKMQAERLAVICDPPHAQRTRYGGIEVELEQVRALEALCELSPERGLNVLAKWRRSPQRAVRIEAAQLTGRLVRPTLVPVIRRLIRGADERIAANAIFGMRLAASPKRERFLTTFVGDLRPLVTGARLPKRGYEGWDLVNSAVNALQRVRGDGGWKLLTSDACVRATNPALPSILWSYHESPEEWPSSARARMRRCLSREFLWQCYDGAKSRKLRELRDGDAHRLMGLVLVLSTKSDSVRVRAEARELLASLDPVKNHELHGRAHQALRAIKGVPEVSVALARFEKNPSSFSPSARAVLRAQELAEYATNDGLQWYLRDASEGWKDAAKGLQLLKLKKAHSVLMQAASIFGRGGPSSNTRERVARFDALSKPKSGVLDRAASQFDGQTGHIFGAVEDYIGAHPSDFRGT